MSLVESSEEEGDKLGEDDVDEEAEPFSDDEEFMRLAEAEAAEEYKVPM
jgi:hypothetical protein